MSRYHSDEFKEQIVLLRKSGRTIRELADEYGLAKSTISTWESQHKNSGKFTVKDNLSESDKELRVLRRENKQLRMENDILKQAALIFAQKDK